jgi:hypothetical protein
MPTEAIRKSAENVVRKRIERFVDEYNSTIYRSIEFINYIKNLGLLTKEEITDIIIGVDLGEIERVYGKEYVDWDKEIIERMLKNI